MKIENTRTHDTIIPNFPVHIPSFSFVHRITANFRTPHTAKILDSDNQSLFFVSFFEEKFGPTAIIPSKFHETSFRTDCTRYTESFPHPWQFEGTRRSFSCLWSKHRSTLEYRGNHGTFLLSRLLDKGYDPHAHRQRNESIPLYKRESNTGSASHPSEMLISCGISCDVSKRNYVLFEIWYMRLHMYNDLVNVVWQQFGWILNEIVIMLFTAMYDGRRFWKYYYYSTAGISLLIINSDKL